MTQIKNILTPQQIADLLEPAMLTCEFHIDGKTTGNGDWKNWLIEQIEKYAKQKTI